MRDHRGIERLFSLFTPADRAEAIVGDLVEERPGRGATWFWWHVLATTAALWGAAAATAPLCTLGLAVAGGGFLVAPALAGVAAVSLFPTLLGSLASWSVLSFFWWGGACWAGASVSAVAPTRGMAACVTLAAMAEGLLLALWVLGVRLDLGSDTSRVFYLTAAGTAVPLLFGAAFAHARVIPLPNKVLEQQ